MLPNARSFYSGRSVLVTGSTGFVGKVLVEKLLSSLLDINNVFILVRSSKGISPEQRWLKTTQNILFDRIRKKCPGQLKKVVVVNGDISIDDLGLSDSDQHMICQEVSVVFHCAATVRFAEPLKEAVNLNVRGVRRVLELCRKMEKLQCLLHCSTTFVQSGLDVLEEKLYPAPCDLQGLLLTLDWLPRNCVDRVTKTLLDGRPNTYVFAKALGEALIEKESGGLPVVILRPSIITSMYREHLPGWTDHTNGPIAAALAVSTSERIMESLASSISSERLSFEMRGDCSDEIREVGKGVLVDALCNADDSIDVVPVDFVVNMIIIAAIYRSTQCFTKIPVLHSCTSDIHPVTNRTMTAVTQQTLREYPMQRSLGIPTFHLHSIPIICTWMHFMRSEIPLYFLDILLLCAGKKRVFFRVIRRMRKVKTLNEPFTKRPWLFKSRSLPMLWDLTSEEDKQIFNFDVRQINWEDAIFVTVMGVKKYIARDNMDDDSCIEQARLQLRLFYIIRSVGVFIAIFIAATFMEWKLLGASLISTAFFLLFLIPCGKTSKMKDIQQYREEQRRAME